MIFEFFWISYSLIKEKKTRLFNVQPNEMKSIWDRRKVENEKKKKMDSWINFSCYLRGHRRPTKFLATLNRLDPTESVSVYDTRRTFSIGIAIEQKFAVAVLKLIMDESSPRLWRLYSRFLIGRRFLLPAIYTHVSKRAENFKLDSE